MKLTGKLEKIESNSAFHTAVKDTGVLFCVGIGSVPKILYLLKTFLGVKNVMAVLMARYFTSKYIYFLT